MITIWKHIDHLKASAVLYTVVWILRDDEPINMSYIIGIHYSLHSNLQHFCRVYKPFTEHLSKSKAYLGQQQLSHYKNTQFRVTESTVSDLAESAAALLSCLQGRIRFSKQLRLGPGRIPPKHTRAPPPYQTSPLTFSHPPGAAVTHTTLRSVVFVQVICRFEEIVFINP